MGQHQAAFFKISGVLNQFGIHYYTINGSHQIETYISSDVSHLLKTTPKKLENLHGHMNTRNLHVRNLHIITFHIQIRAISKER